MAENVMRKGRQPGSLLPGCFWVDMPPDLAADIPAWNTEEALGFRVQRAFWLTNIAPGQWRGHHAHRESILATLMVNGRCRVELDDGECKQTVELSDQGKGLVIGPWVWHRLVDFSPSAAVLVLASTRYNEAEYIRDYDRFLREARERRRCSAP